MKRILPSRKLFAATLARKPIFATLLAALATVANAGAFNALHSFDFNTNGDTEGWSPTGTTLIVADGVASGTASTGDPQVARTTGFNFPGNASSGVLIRYRGSTNGNAELFWGRTGANTFNAARSVTVPYTGNGEWQTLFFRLQGHAEWDDSTITRLRFDPAGGAGSTFEIDWIRALSWDYDNDGVPDSHESAEDSNGNGLLDLEDIDSSGDRMPDGWARFIANAPGSVHFDFNEDGNAEGWAPLEGGKLTLLGVENGSMHAQVLSTGVNTPMVIRRAIHLEAALIDGLIIRIQSSASTISARLYWTHDGAGGGSFSGTTRNKAFSVPASTTPRSVYIDLRAASEWKGNMITGLRIDFPFAAGTTLSIDYIHTSDGDYDRDGIHDMDEGTADMDGDGLANFEDVDSDGDGISDAEEILRGWGPLDPIEGTRDADGDGVSDADEAIAGTAPDSPDERPSLAIQPSGGGYDLTMQSSPGRSYTLESTDDLTLWVAEPVIPHVEGSPTLTWHFTANPSSPRQFFRTKITRPLEMHDWLGGNGSTVEIGSTETAFLDNGTLRMGTPTTQGGSINFLAPSNGANLVNWYDPGRLIQQSYYAGQLLDRTADGQHTRWSPWSWNPIQGGDASGKKSQVIEMTQFDSGKGFFTRSVPLLWDMTTGEKAKAWIDQWNQFEPDMPNVIRVTCRFISFRDSNDVWTEVRPKHQELPAVYLIRSLSQVFTYQGASPWTNDTIEDVTANIIPGPPWILHYPTESWVAMVNPTTGLGLGLYSPFGNVHWSVGATGTTPTGGEKSSRTMHISPIRTMSLDRNSIVIYRYWMIYGNIQTIRQRIYELRAKYPHG